MQVAGLDPDKVEYAMRTHDGKVWVQKINVTSVGVKEVLLRMADVKTRAGSGEPLVSGRLTRSLEIGGR